MLDPKSKKVKDSKTTKSKTSQAQAIAGWLSWGNSAVLFTFVYNLFISVCWSLSVFQFCILSRHCCHSVVSACLNCLDTRFAGLFFLTPNPISSTESFHRNLRSSLIFVFILSMSQGQPLDQQDLEFELEKQRLWDTTWYNWAMIITWIRRYWHWPAGNFQSIPTPFESAWSALWSEDYSRQTQLGAQCRTSFLLVYLFSICFLNLPEEECGHSMSTFGKIWQSLMQIINLPASQERLHLTHPVQVRQQVSTKQQTAKCIKLDVKWFDRNSFLSSLPGARKRSSKTSSGREGAGTET